MAKARQPQKEQKEVKKVISQTAEQVNSVYIGGEITKILYQSEKCVKFTICNTRTLDNADKTEIHTFISIKIFYPDIVYEEGDNIDIRNGILSTDVLTHKNGDKSFQTVIIVSPDDIEVK